jgi:hypothetical protein
MRTTRVVLLVLLVFALCGCKSASREKEAAAIFSEGNRIWSESTTTTKEWTAEYANAFGPENRAKFPANRASLRSSADKIVKILDKETRLSTEAIKHYEKAIALISDEQKRRGMGLLVSSLRKTLEAYEFIKSQMRLVTDESIVDARTFEEKFLGLGAQFGRSHRDSQSQLDEGRRILGI